MLGADPEIFLVDSHGTMKSAHRAFPKVGKHEGLIQRPTGKISRDGVTVEINPRPDPCRETLFDSCAELLAFVRLRAASRGYRLAFQPTMPLTKRELALLPPDAQYFGCEASLNAYTEAETQIHLDDPATHPYRYAGGHMHISCGNNPVPAEQARACVKLWDLYLGVPLTFLFKSKETFLRRRYYGQAGDYRPQKYGIQGDYGLEYRVPGPELFKHSVPFSLAFGLFRHIYSNRAHLWGPVADERGLWEDVQGTINTGTNATQLLRLYHLPEWATPQTLAKLAEWLKRPRGESVGYNGISSWRRRNHI